MTHVDLRRPAVITEEFRSRVAGVLAPRGFAPRARGASLVRKLRKNTHRIEFSSSHLNCEGNVTCWVGPFFDDDAVRRIEKGWRAGGLLTGPYFSEEIAVNIAVAANANALADRIVQLLDFFELLENPLRVLGEVRRRYVPGFVEPLIVVPYLRAHLGREAVSEYAGSLLAACPELWPAFASTRPVERDARSVVLADHGTQLAMALTAEERPAAWPADLVTSTDKQAKALRSFFGLQLRAWGEPAAAGELRRITDEDILRAHAETKALGEGFVDSAIGARLILRTATGEDRPPRRLAPSPRLFQYHVRHDPFDATTTRDANPTRPSQTETEDGR